MYPKKQKICLKKNSSRKVLNKLIIKKTLAPIKTRKTMIYFHFYENGEKTIKNKPKKNTELNTLQVS